MFANKLLSYVQKFLAPLYFKSVLLRNIDTLIFACILSIIIVSGFAPSDNIGYFAIFAILLTLIKLLVKPNERFRMSLADKFLLAYFLLVLISVAGSTLLALSFKGFTKTLIYIGFYISFVHFLKDNRSKLKYIIITLALTGFAEALIAFKQNFLCVAEISGWQDMSRLNPEEVMTRVYGAIKPYNPNLFGGYMLSVLPSSLLLIFLPLRNKHNKTALIGLFALAMLVSSIIMTGCRGAYVGVFTEIILIILLTYKFLKPMYKKIFLTLTLLGTGLSALCTLSVTSLRARIFSIFAMRSDSSNSFRFNVYNSCIDMFKDNWLLGIGVGNKNFREIYGLYMKTGFDALSAYNIYLETAVESGIFALLAFLAFLIVNMVSALRYILKKRTINVIYLSIAIISITGMLVHGFVDTVFFRPQIQFVFWIMMGIIRVITYPRSIYASKRN